MNGVDTLNSKLDKLQRRGLAAGGVGLTAWLVCALAGFAAPAVLQVALGAYLIAFLYFLGIVLGCLAVLMIQHLTGGEWARVIRRVLEAATRTLPVVAVFFIPLLLGVKGLYEWSRPEIVTGDEVLQHKSLYLNIPFFTARAIFYFAAWMLLMFLLNRWGREQERLPTNRLARRFRLLSGPGLVLYGLTITYASVDWAMSLEPHWFSTIYGMLFMIGQASGGLAFAIAATLTLLRWRGAKIADRETLAHLGSLMMAFLMLWAYIALSQFLIIWAGNLPEEIPWYIPRMTGGWGVLGLLLAVFHFFVPFALLLPASFKRNPNLLLKLAILILIMRAVDLIWTIAPAFSAHGHHGGPWAALLTLVVMLGIGGIWLSLFIRQLRSRSLAPYPETGSVEAENGVEVVS